MKGSNLLVRGRKETLAATSGRMNISWNWGDAATVKFRCLVAIAERPNIRSLLIIESSQVRAKQTLGVLETWLISRGLPVFLFGHPESLTVEWRFR